MTEDKEPTLGDFLASDSVSNNPVDPVCAGTGASSDSGTDPATVEELGKYWSRLAMILGYNELAKTVNDAGQKSFYRYMRDNIQEEWVKEGGIKDFITYGGEDVIVQITAPQPPHINFYERDIEMMRDAVYKYDTEKRSK